MGNFRMKSLVIIFSILFASLLFVETEVRAEDIDLEDSDDDGIPDDEVKVYRLSTRSLTKKKSIVPYLI